MPVLVKQDTKERKKMNEATWGLPSSKKEVTPKREKKNSPGFASLPPLMDVSRQYQNQRPVD